MSNTDFQSKRKQNQDHPQSNHHAKHNKRLRKDVRATPWRDMWELEAVGRALISVTRQPNIPNNEFSENTMTIEQALETVAVWRARSDALGGLSHAVECTAALSQVHWRDMSQQGSFLVSATELRLAYSAAIIRCINGFADMLQQQRFMAAPVSTLCGQLGIASWLVDIRHESSHNALPTLGELRLGATTLLDFLKSEYWIPTCPNWEPGNDEHDVQKQLQQKPTHYLLQYKSCATSASSSSAESAPKSTDINSAGSTKRKPKKSKPATITRPIDMFFGDVGDSSSSSDDDDWDPILGSVWGSSVGTSNNRFALLQSTTKKKEKKTKSSQNQQKKKLGEKYPIDYAKDFVRAVAPQEGLSTALTFLVWGGVGTSPSGRGVLIPGSAAAFPASEQGIMKCWQRYSPLIQVLGRTWPGFCPALLVHLVDFVLSIEDGVVEQSTVDAGSARKLYFLSAWIRLLLSQLFVAKLDSTFVSKKASKTKGTKTTELELAELSWLQKLQYPLNSICDRCIESDDNSELRKTSRDILHSLEEILGDERVPGFGIPFNKALKDAKNPRVQEGPSLLIPQVSPQPVDEETILTDKTDPHTCKMSLGDIEAMLSEDESSEKLGGNNKSPAKEKSLMSSDSIGEEPQLTKDKTSTDETCNNRSNGANNNLTPTSEVRPAWIRCASWDPCSIGTLPGYPV